MAELDTYPLTRTAAVARFGTTVRNYTAGATIAANAPVRISSTDGKAYPANASAASTMGAVGVAPTGAANGATVQVVHFGEVVDCGQDLTPGKPVYVNTGGGLTQSTAAFVAGNVVSRIGTATGSAAATTRKLMVAVPEQEVTL